MTNHTEQEIAKFNAMADDFWNVEGKFKALHQINPIRVAFCQEFIDLQDKRVADIGCGGGILAEALADKGASVIGIDLSEVGIAAAKAHQQYTGSEVDYRVQSVSELKQAVETTNTPFDGVFCMEMLEHVENPAQIIADCAKMTAKDGIVVFSTINRTKKAHLLAVIMAEYVLRMIPKGTHDARLFIKPSEMQKMAIEAGLKPLDIIGFDYRPLTSDFVRSRKTDINYIFAFQKT